MSSSGMSSGGATEGWPRDLRGAITEKNHGRADTEGPDFTGQTEDEFETTRLASRVRAVSCTWK